MLTLLKNYHGKVEVNGRQFDSVNKAISSTQIEPGKEFTIKLFAKQSKRTTAQPGKPDTQKKITVKAYMTRKSTPEFTFMKEWNHDTPMPLRTMIGTVEKETRGMVYMKLHGDITSEKTQRCLACGRPITNPVSQYFGMGPECGGHNYINPFYSAEELKQAVETYRNTVLKNMTWEGWIIKSAIIEEEDI